MVTGGGNDESRCVCVDTRGTEMSDGCNKVSIENPQDFSSGNFSRKSWGVARNRKGVGGWGVDLGILTKVTLLVPSINYHFFINGVSKIIITCLLATVQIDMFYTSQRLVHAHSKRVS